MQNRMKVSSGPPKAHARPWRGHRDCPGLAPYESTRPGPVPPGRCLRRVRRGRLVHYLQPPRDVDHLNLDGGLHLRGQGPSARMPTPCARTDPRIRKVEAPIGFPSTQVSLEANRPVELQHAALEDAIRSSATLRRQKGYDSDRAGALGRHELFEGELHGTPRDGASAAIRLNPGKCESALSPGLPAGSACLQQGSDGRQHAQLCQDSRSRLAQRGLRQADPRS